MKYTLVTEINKPIEEVIKLFDNPDNMSHWMDGLQSFEHLSGTPGQVGAKSILRFKTGKRELQMTETILVRNLPEEFCGAYEAKGVFNMVNNKFIKISEDKTQYITENEFRFTGIMKVMAFMMAGSFKKQSCKYLEDFKSFAENQSN